MSDTTKATLLGVSALCLGSAIAFIGYQLGAENLIHQCFIPH